MPTQVLAVGTGAANSSDIVIADGESKTLCLKDAAGPTLLPGVRADVLIKDDAGEYFLIATMGNSRPALVIAGAGTYRVTRPATSASVGVFSG